MTICVVLYYVLTLTCRTFDLAWVLNLKAAIKEDGLSLAVNINVVRLLFVSLKGTCLAILTSPGGPAFRLR